MCARPARSGRTAMAPRKRQEEVGRFATRRCVRVPTRCTISTSPFPVAPPGRTTCPVEASPVCAVEASPMCPVPNVTHLPGLHLAPAQPRPRPSLLAGVMAVPLEHAHAQAVAQAVRAARTPPRRAMPTRRAARLRSRTDRARVRRRGSSRTAPCRAPCRGRPARRPCPTSPAARARRPSPACRRSRPTG